MEGRRVNDRLSVAGQPDAEAFDAIREAGFSAVINLRPDGEDGAQPGHAREKDAAQSAGLDYSFIPVTGETITRADIRAFQEAVASADGPVYAHCKGGTRALALHVLGEVLDGRMGVDDVEAHGRDLGYDLSGAVRWLKRELGRAPLVEGFFDPRTFSIQYVVSDPATRRCAIIDPVLDFEEKSGAVATTNADALLDHARANGLEVEWILDTHPHADHFSAAHYLKQKTGAPTAIGARIADVQALWSRIYNQPELADGGPYWDRLFADGDSFTIGSLDARVMLSPGHTLASITYVVGDAAFVHDTLFMPDSGTARADFPGGSAAALWDSIGEIIALPDETRLFTGHDYQPGGRAPKWESTVAQQKQSNAHLAGSAADFIARREARDRTLPMPKLILHALQVNVRGGRLPEPENDGRRYLKFPLDALEGAVW